METAIGSIEYLEPWRTEASLTLGELLRRLREAAALIEQEHEVRVSLHSAVREHAIAASRGHAVMQETVRTMLASASVTANASLEQTIEGTRVLRALIGSAIQCLDRLPARLVCIEPHDATDQRIEELRTHVASLTATAARHIDLLAHARTLVRDEIAALQHAMVELMQRRA